MVSRCYSVEELKTSTDRPSPTLLSAPDNHQPSDDGSSSSIDAPDARTGSPSTDVSPAESSLAHQISFTRTDHESFGKLGEVLPLENGLDGGPNCQWKRHSARLSYARLKSPDRFLPERQFQSDVVQLFRLSKNPSQLSQSERIHRRRSSGNDPFRRSNPVRSLSPRRRSPESNRSLSPRHLPRHVEQTALGIWHNAVSLTGPQRAGPSPGWTIGGPLGTPTNPAAAVPDGHGGFLGSGTLSPMHVVNFKTRGTREEYLQMHQSRIALALDIDQASRVIKCYDDTLSSWPTSSSSSPMRDFPSPTWKDDAWVYQGRKKESTSGTPKSLQRAVPSTPFRVLDAPLLRDDYYCSTLAYCYTTRQLAVGLGNRVYIWSEVEGVRHPPLPVFPTSNYVTSLSFSSAGGKHSILAVGRHGGQLVLWSTFDSDVRFETRMPSPVSCVVFKDTTTRRYTRDLFEKWFDSEDLVVGDETGMIWYYSIEWTTPELRRRSSWKGSMTLLAKISAHTQQICGMVWSPDGTYLASGGNDNACLLFDIVKILEKDEFQAPPMYSEHMPGEPVRRSRTNRSHIHLNRMLELHYRSNDGVRGPPQESWSNKDMVRRPAHVSTLGSKSHKFTRNRTLLIPPGQERHRLPHAAAVKALAFAPWQPSLLATGGGSNDRCIRFYHAPSGACLATINVQAQVTSLIWSKTCREIAATFGYTQPQHPFRIAVFAWPSCQQVLAIPWGTDNDVGEHRRYSAGYNGCGRALWAISYPGGPNETLYDDSASERSVFATHSVSFGSSTAARDSSSAAVTVGSTSDPQSLSGEHRSRSRNRTSFSEGERWWPRTAEEGCIIVASSDECVKFHEVWSGSSKTVTRTSGLLGGSDILEILEGIEKEEREIIR